MFKSTCIQGEFYLSFIFRHTHHLSILKKFIHPRNEKGTLLKLAALGTVSLLFPLPVTLLVMGAWIPREVSAFSDARSVTWAYPGRIRFEAEVGRRPTAGGESDGVIKPLVINIFFLISLESLSTSDGSRPSVMKRPSASSSCLRRDEMAERK